MILKRKSNQQQTLTAVLKPVQRNIDKKAVTGLASIRADIESIRMAVEWLNNNKALIARPPHSKLSDLTDGGLVRFANDIKEQAQALAEVGESLKTDLLKTFGESEAIKRLRKNSGDPSLILEAVRLFNAKIVGIEQHSRSTK
jgi:hypothetical protein